MSKIVIPIEPPEPRSWKNARTVATVLALLTFIGGTTSFLGWVLDMPQLTSWDGTGISIQPNAALAVFCASAALILFLRRLYRSCLALGVFVAFIGLSSVFQIVTGIDLGINQLFMFGREWGRRNVVSPGLMGTPASTSWTMIGLALIVMALARVQSVSGYKSSLKLSVGFAFTTLSISSLSIIGFIYGAEILYSVPNVTVIAFQTAIFIFLVSLSILLSIPGYGPIKLFLEESAAGSMMRRLVPVLAVIPLVLGLIRLGGEHADFYDLAFGTASRTITEIFLLLLLLWWAAVNVSRQEKLSDTFRVEARESAIERAALADAMPQVVWIANGAGDVTYYNRRVEEFAGVERTPEDLYQWQPAIHPDDIDSTLAAWQEARESGTVYSHEHRIQMADDNYRWHLSRAIPSLDADGNADKWFGTATDIHDIKIIEEEYRETEERLRLAVEAGQLGIWESDPNTLNLYWDERTRELFGVSPDEEISYDETMWRVIPEEEHPIVRVAAVKALDPQGDGIYDTEHRVRLADGRLRWLHNRGRVEFDERDGAKRPLLMRGTVVDITERKYEETRFALLARLGDLIRTSEDPAELLYSVAHAVGDSLNAQRCLFNEIDLDTRIETVHRDYFRSGTTVTGMHSIDEYSSVALEEMSQGSTVVNFDSQSDVRTAEFYKRTYGPAGERAYVAVPLMREGRWVASFWISDDSPRMWSDAEVRMIESIGERTWLAVEKLRGEQRLRISQETFFRLVEEAPFGVYVIDSGFKLAQASAATKKVFANIDPLLGRDLSEILGILWQEPFASEAIQRFRHTLETGESYHSADTTEPRKNVDDVESYDWLIKRITLPDGQYGVVCYFYDMTERKKAEALLRQREQRLSISTGAAELGVFEWDVIEDETVWENERLHEIFGLKVGDESLNRKEFFVQYMHLEDVDCFAKSVDEAKKSGILRRAVCRIVRPDGAVRWIEINGQFEYDDSSVPVRLVGVVADITERQEAERVLKQAEERRKLAQEAGNVGIWDWNIREDITYWSETMWTLYGVKASKQNPDEHFWSSHLHEEDRERVRAKLHEVVNTDSPRFREEFRIVLRDGTQRWIQSVASVSRDTDGSAVRMYGVNTDISNRKESEEALQRAHDELELRVKERTEQLATANQSLLLQIQERKVAERERIDLLHRLVSSQEVERSRIARDIHDQLGQRLTALRLKIASLKEAAGDDDVIALRIEHLQEIGEKLDSEVSFLAWELRPSGLDDLGFVEAIGEYVREWSSHMEIRADFHASDMSGIRLERETETHLYRITQEALNNAAKHAEASHLAVLLDRRDGHVIMVIEDDGKGFIPTELHHLTDASGGLGLVGMKERALLVDGDVEIESKPGAGTTIFVRVPFIS